MGTEIRRAVQQARCTNKCLSHDDPWTPVLDQPKQRAEWATQEQLTEDRQRAEIAL